MELYTDVSYELSRRLTLRYSSSFGLSSRLFDRTIRSNIYAIYGLVRIADEIVDTYAGDDRQQLLDNLEAEVLTTIARSYSTNPIVHAFSKTASHYGIDETLIRPFFASMRMDIVPEAYTQANYQTYIYGSAEVIGLMCLRVFCAGDTARYDSLAPGARALGAAYQKVNFLRDIAADHNELGRMYFPGVTYAQMSELDKRAIAVDIMADFTAAQPSLAQLPRNSKAAVMLSVMYYRQLLTHLERASVDTIKANRLRISTPRKVWLLLIAVVRYKVVA